MSTKLTGRHIIIVASPSTPTLSTVGEHIHLKGYMGNCISFESPRDEVAHSSQLAVVADIAEAALVMARAHEVNIEESEDKS